MNLEELREEDIYSGNSELYSSRLNENSCNLSDKFESELVQLYSGGKMKIKLNLYS